MQNMTLPGRCTATVKWIFKNKHRCEPYACLLNWSAHAQPGSAGKSKQVRFGAEMKWGAACVRWKEMSAMRTMGFYELYDAIIKHVTRIKHK